MMYGGAPQKSSVFRLKDPLQSPHAQSIQNASVADHQDHPVFKDGHHPLFDA
jgi:hypothetical protein